MTRCSWCGDDPLYVAYHDEEWGVPVHDDRHLFEMLIRRGAGRVVVDHDFAQARGVSKSIRRVRRQKDCRLQVATVARACQRRRHRAQTHVGFEPTPLGLTVAADAAATECCRDT